MIAEIEEKIARSLIVLPSVNGARLLERMLPSLRVSPEIVIVLDQNSSDDSEKVCIDAGVEFIQLGRRYTYTEACNYGAALAKQRGVEFLFVGNNDIVFKTDVARELMAEMASDPQLGIVAPAQILVDESIQQRILAYRVFWDLEKMLFQHDFSEPPLNTIRIEADFCELTFALLRMSTIEKIGFLDDAYGFYHEDADFGIRLGQAGFSCAYLPKSQIEHYVSSTFSLESKSRKENYIKKNKALFKEKHLGYGVWHSDHKSDASNSWNIINKNLHPYLRRFGLVDESRPALTFSHPTVGGSGYLYTVWETTKIPQSWIRHINKYKACFTTSAWNVEVLQEAGCKNVRYMPLGVETDIFHPWGSIQRLYEGVTFLWFANNQYRKGLDIILSVWGKFYEDDKNAKLIIMGHNIRNFVSIDSAPCRRWGSFNIYDFKNLGYSIYEVVSSISEEKLSEIYRSVDFTVSTSRSEGFGFTVAESLACGTPAIYGNFGGTRDFGYPGALTVSGVPVKADYLDKGFDEVGNWWEPSSAELLERLQQAIRMPEGDYQQLSEAGVRLVRQKFTWRRCVYELRAALLETEVQRRPDLDKEIVLPSEAFVPHSNAEQVAVSMKSRRVQWRAAEARQLRRIGVFFELLAADWESRGIKHALGRAWDRLSSFGNSRKNSLLSKWFRSRRNVPVPSKQPPVVSRGEKCGTLFVGYIQAGLGLGESLRGLVASAKSRALDFGIYPFQVGVEARLIGEFMEERYDTTHSYDIAVMEVAADQVPILFQAIDPSILSRSYKVLRTYWELPLAPPKWKPMLAEIDEIWAPNNFVRDAFKSIFSGPISIVPPCVEPEAEDLPSREAFNLDADRFYFLFTFDFYSALARKNPLAVLDAFQRAFPEGSENVGLVLKSTGAADHHPEVKLKFAAAAEIDSRIRIIDSNMKRKDILGLIKSCDCYVSLHRSEGFGLGMAEAMYFGRSVIGTNYSGSVDFLTGDTGFPVDYKLRPIEEGEYFWSEGQVWAEPDIESAVNAFRTVFNNPEVRQQRRDAGAAFIRKKYSQHAVGKIVEERLDQIQAVRSPSGGALRREHPAELGCRSGEMKR